MKTNKLLTYILILSIAVLTVVTVTPVTQVCADTPGTVTIDESVLEDDILYYNTFTVKFEVTTNQGWFYGGAYIFINNVAVGSTTNTSFEKNYFPEAYAGSHSLYVEANWVNLNLEVAWEDDAASYTVVTCVNRTNIEDLRIDKLHDYESNKGYLDGDDVTVCIIEDRLGCSNNDDEKFHKSLIYSGKNDLYGQPYRRYLDIDYYEHIQYSPGNWSFTQQWNNGTDTIEKKWQELYLENNSSSYSMSSDVHGTYVLATMRQIAPAAKYIFVATDDDAALYSRSVTWIHENFQELGIDIVVMAWGGDVGWETKFSDFAGNGTITVNAAGNSNTTWTSSVHAAYPCSFNSTIGVAGVFDSDHGASTNQSWTRGDLTNGGYGVDIAAICNSTSLDWSPVTGVNEFNFTSSATPIVAGVLALLEQYQDNYKSSTDLSVSIVQKLFEETGDALGSAPSSNTTEVGGCLSWLNDAGGPYPNFPYEYPANFTTYWYGWGIIDAYESFDYFRDNY